MANRLLRFWQLTAKPKNWLLYGLAVENWACRLVFRRWLTTGNRSFYDRRMCSSYLVRLVILVHNLEHKAGKIHIKSTNLFSFLVHHHCRTIVICYSNCCVIVIIIIIIIFIESCQNAIYLQRSIWRWRYTVMMQDIRNVFLSQRFFTKRYLKCFSLSIRLFTEIARSPHLLKQYMYVSYWCRIYERRLQ